MQAAPGDKDEEDGKGPQVGDNENKEMEVEDFKNLANSEFGGSAPNDKSEPYDEHGTSNGHVMPKNTDSKRPNNMDRKVVFSTESFPIR